MKMVINECYGGFSLPEEFCENFGFDSYDDIDRTNPDLIDFIEAKGGEVRYGCAHLVVEEIPDEVTDWEINEYDGYESIIYVLDGKIHHA